MFARGTGLRRGCDGNGCLNLWRGCDVLRVWGDYFVTYHAYLAFMVWDIQLSTSQGDGQLTYEAERAKFMYHTSIIDLPPKHTCFA